MTQHRFFKLSAISIALFGFASQGYAIECNAPISLRNQQGAVLDNCSLERSVEKDSRIPGNTLINIDRSDLNILNSTINSKSDSYYARGMLNAEESKVTIKGSTISHFASSNISGYLLRADGSDIMIDNSTIKGNDILMLYLHRPSTINVNNSTFESERFLVRDNSVWVGAPLAEKTTININNSKILSKQLFNNFFGNYAESIDLNINKSEINGEAELSPSGMLINMALTDSKWSIPARGTFWRPNSVNNLEMSGSEVIFAKSSSEDILFSFNTLNIDGNLSGSGHFDLNTNLYEQLSDKIIVKGEDSGNFTLGINNSGNEPNTANGKVTLVETQQGRATFSLKDREYVDAGAYRYRLNKEGTNWVLSNRAGEKTAQPTPAVQPVETPDITSPTEMPTTPTETAVQPTTPTVVPATETPTTPTETAVQPTTPTVVPATETPTTPTEMVVQPTAPIVVVPVTPPTEVSTPVVQPSQSENVMLSEKSNALASLRQAQSVLVNQNLQGIHQRLGELKTDKVSNVWVKNTNSRTDVKAQNVAADSRSSGFEMDTHSLQIGADRAVSDNFRLGGFVGSSRADVDFNGEYGKGKLRSQAVGFYTTFANAEGWYVDNVGKYERLTSQSQAEKRKYNAFSLSNEIGKRIALANDWTVTPQAQIAYHTINGKADESRLSLFTARAGVRVAKGFSFANGWNLQPYAEFHAIAEKANNANVRVNQYRFDVPENRGRFQTAIGFTAGNSSHRLGLEVSTTHGKQIKQPLAVLANYRYQW